MAPIVAVLEARVLYAAPLRDFLMHLDVRDAFAARWSAAIHEEWMRNVLANRPDLTLAQRTRTRNLMNSSVGDCLVTGQEGLIDSLALSDAEDRHVLATAIHSQADVIVTFNLKDFPSHRLESFENQAIHRERGALRTVSARNEHVRRVC